MDRCDVADESERGVSTRLLLATGVDTARVVSGDGGSIVSLSSSIRGTCSSGDADEGGLAEMVLLL
jgi:hypothetical protein